MTNKTNKTNRTNLIPPHGGYRKLKSYQTAEIIYDGTVEFCERHLDKTHRTKRTYRGRGAEQMVQGARSGKHPEPEQSSVQGSPVPSFALVLGQNIAEASQVSGTSKKTELKLLGVARASLEELLQDFLDFLRQRGLKLWAKDSAKARKIRALAYRSNRSYKTYKFYIESDEETAANTMICLIHQANYLLDRQIKALEKQFLEEGGFTERLYQKRTERLLKEKKLE